MLVPALLEMGTQEQKEQFIRPTIHGEMLWCQGIQNQVQAATSQA